MHKHKCAYCGCEYETDTYYSKYCSDVCRNAAEEQRKQEYAKTKTRICKRCGKEFQVPKLANGNYSHKLYCSDACTNNTLLDKTVNYYQPMKTCANCGKLFPVPHYCNDPTKPFAHDRKYCSDKCEQETIDKFKKEYEKHKTRVCKVCGKTFNVPRVTDGHFSETLFCSEECRYAGRSKAQLAAQEQREQTCIEKYGVIYPCLTKQCREANFSINSNINEEFANKLKENDIVFDTEFVIDNFAYDFKIGNILVEINPTYTHSVCGNHFDAREYRQEFEKYHALKTKTASDNNYHCINIWDWDNWDNILSFLKPKQKLYARNLQLKLIEKHDANAFLVKYHMQSKCKGNSVNLGLYQDNELIQVMTFGKPRYNKNYQWELLRLCTHSDYIVVGGAEKLFKHFIQQYNPESIISYCDMSKFAGDVYVRLGFKLKIANKPQKIWSKGTAKITDNLLRQRGFDQLFNTNYGKGTNNEQLMLDAGWKPVFDCGQNTYIWTNNILDFKGE